LRAGVAAMRAASRRPERIELLGLVPEAELVRLYQHASALIITSRYEGFGLPAIEAMASATPVIAFDNSALTEVVGDAGVLVEDGDTVAMAAHVEAILASASRRSELSARGLARAAGFTWEEAARRHEEVYTLVAGDASARPGPA
jgi:glycosyltransferase involved in cell wall biosynthesis